MKVLDFVQLGGTWNDYETRGLATANKHLVMQLARCEYVDRRENVIAVGNSGTGKTHVALGLGLAACQRGMSVGFTTAASLVHELIEARDERRLLNLQKKLARLKQRRKCRDLLAWQST